MVYLATLAQVSAEVVNVKDADTPLLLDALRHASARLEAKKIGSKGATYFEPRRETRYFDAEVGAVSPDGRTLIFTDILLADIIAITLGDGTTVDVADVRAMPRGQTPIRELVLTNGASWLVHDGTPQQAIAIDGIWCWRTAYAREAWDDVAIADGILASEAILSVDTAAPFSPGHLIRIGTEYMRVDAVDTEEDELAVTRGVNGTTAADHGDNAVVAVFVPEDVVNRAAKRWASYLYAWKGSFAKSTFDGTAYISFPQDMPDEIANTLKDIRTRRSAFGG